MIIFLGGEFMGDCIFCKIIKGDIPSKKLYEDELVYAFYDINPEAPVHFLVIPKEHIKSVNELNEKNINVVSHIFKVINKLVVELGIADSGYRIVNNCGEDGGQTVNHMHFHILAGRNLQWPPG
ncbi:putative nucleotide-binding protein [Clostridium botulinum B str. Eklund 17B (NRP)]|nr:putative nucleotide-binding protein [Clostridium botulinum B str. Eklund 17B (NRP)]